MESDSTKGTPCVALRKVEREREQRERERSTVFGMDRLVVRRERRTERETERDNDRESRVRVL